MSRVLDRATFDERTRLQLIEGDMDRFDTALEAIRDEIKGLTRVMTGILVAVATAAILLAVNIAIRALSTGPTP